MFAVVVVFDNIVVVFYSQAVVVVFQDIAVFTVVVLFTLVE